MAPLAGLKKHFSQVMWSRGQKIAKLGNVSNFSISAEEKLISGTVQSEVSDAKYEVMLDLDEEEISAVCTCPVRKFCKHAGALAIEAMKQNGELSVAANEDVEKWLSSMKQPQLDTNESTDVIVYLLETSEFNRFNGVSISVLRTRELASGAYSKSIRHVHLSEYELRQPSLSQEERHLLADIIASKHALDYHEDFALIERIVNTNRCFWQKVGDAPLALGRICSANFKWHKKQKNVFKLITELNIPKAEILYTQPPCYIDSETNQIGRIEFPLETDRAISLMKMPTVSSQQLAWILPQLKSYLAEKFTEVGLPEDDLNHAVFEPVIHLHLQSPHYYPENAIAILTFFYNEIEINPRESGATVTTSEKVLSRNLWFENESIERLHKMGFKTMPSNEFNGYGSNEYRLSLSKTQWPSMLHAGIPDLKQLGWQVSINQNFYYSITRAENFNAEIEEQNNGFFTLSVEVEINGKKQALLPILQSAISQLPKEELLNPTLNDESDIYIDRGKGEFLSLPLATVKPLINQFVELFLPNSLNKAGKLPVSKLLGHHTLDVLEKNNINNSGGEDLRRFSHNLRNFGGIEPVKCPETIHADLRDYQQAGLNWLQFLREYNLSGILADDMGLGKTLQAIANVAIEKKEGRLTHPALIIAPTSVIFNWQNEIEKFCPDLKHIVVHGEKRADYFDDFQDYEVVITSYALIVRDLRYYVDQFFHYLILDEAQYIKNPKTKLYDALTSLNATHKLCMTGTPMENHLGELWSQFNFILPSFLGNKSQFTKLFRTPIEKQKSQERQQVLNHRIKPFVLRRTKDKIAKELPAKTEIIQTVRLEGKQAALYENVRLSMDDKLRSIIQSKGLMRSQIEILDAMLKLRQVCCHPQLLSLPSARNVKESAKLNHLIEIIPELVSEGRRILLFSQFTSMLAIIEPELKKIGIDYVKLTGNTKNRQKVINTFKEGKAPVFLISLKAGGTGLNLTEADVVIHYDPWWNPAVENQATDRVHRIGQDKPVFVYKLVVEGSIEQKIVDLQAHKSALANAVLSDELSEKSVGLDANTLTTLFQPLSS